MKNALAFIPVLCLLAAPAMAQTKTSKPQPEVTPPEWTKQIQVTNVAKYLCKIKNAKGVEFDIARDGTDIGDGLIATRRRYRCWVTDPQGIRCRYNRAQNLSACMDSKLMKQDDIKDAENP